MEFDALLTILAILVLVFAVRYMRLMFTQFSLDEPLPSYQVMRYVIALTASIFAVFTVIGCLVYG